MNQDQCKLLADKLCNLGNLAVVALIFGQLIKEKGLNLWVAILGGFIWIICHVTGIYLLRRTDNDK
jgi:hypothetical protein